MIPNFTDSEVFQTTLRRIDMVSEFYVGRIKNKSGNTAAMSYLDTAGTILMENIQQSIELGLWQKALINSCAGSSHAAE